MKEFFLRSLLIMLGLAIALVAAETWLYFQGLPRLYATHTYPPQFAFVEDSQREPFYLNAPASVIRFIYDGNPRGYFDQNNGIDHTVNSWGFRGKEFSYTKPPGVIRIAFFGDSFTFGEGVKDRDTFPEVTSRLLQARAQPSKLRYESLNFGVGGYNTEQELFLLRQVGLMTNPDIVVLGVTLNDAEPALWVRDEKTGAISRRPREADVTEGLADARPAKTGIFRLRLARLIWALLKKQAVSRQTIRYYQGLYQEENSDWQKNKTALADFIQECASRRISCYVVIFPVLYSLNNYPFAQIHRRIKDIAESRGARVIDARGLLKQYRDTSLWVHPTDQHPNEKAHQVIAQALSDLIVTLSTRPAVRLPPSKE